jgi:hypothetical protein
MARIRLTTYQHHCLRRAMEGHSYVMLPREPALARLTVLKLVTIVDRERGAVWIAPTGAGLTWLHRHPKLNSYLGSIQ